MATRRAGPYQATSFLTLVLTVTLALSIVTAITAWSDGLWIPTAIVAILAVRALDQRQTALANHD